MMNYTETMKYWLTLFSLLTLLVCCNKERDQLIGKGATDKTFEVDNYRLADRCHASLKLGS